MNPWWNQFIFFATKIHSNLPLAFRNREGFPLFLLVQYVLAVVLFKAKKQLYDIVPGK